MALIKAIKNINKSGGCDVIIFGRGGGSKEDLSAFNEEDVVRAVAKSKIPVISAVGHEIDRCLCDFAADVYAATPTAAAQMVCRAGFEIRNSFEEAAMRFKRTAKRRISAISDFEQLTDDFSIDLRDSFKKNYERKFEIIRNCEQILNALNPNLPLKKGFAIIKNEDGKIIESAKNLSLGQKIKIIFDNDKVIARVDEL